MQQTFESIEVKAIKTACDGGGGALGHPKVYIHLDHATGVAVCPYCSRTFVLAPVHEN